MKKIFRSFMAIALAAMTFTACEDVPEPYAWPEANNGGTEGTVAGNGTETEPLTVEQAIAKASAAGSWVTGYIVGANSGAPDYTFITDPTQITIASNIYIAATPTETDQSKCMPIQLPVGAVRTAINLADNKTVIGKQVTLYGDIDTYFSQPGLKNTSFVKIDDKEFGTKPSEGGEAPAVSAKNTIETALSVADMLKVIDALGEGETSADWYYVKGKIKNIKTAAADIAKYKNIDYFITDDGQNEVQIFRGKNLNNTDFTEAGQINVGDEVVVVGQPMKYKNANTGAIIPEIAQGNYIVKLTKGSGGENPTPTPVPTGEAKGDGTKANPYNAVKAAQIANALEAGAKTEEVYIAGKVSTITENYGTQYGNGTFKISDDGQAANEFLIFRALYLGNQKYTAGTLLKEGDDVVICGKIMKYANKSGDITLETSQGEAYLFSLNGKTEASGEGGQTPDPTPTPQTDVTKTIDGTTMTLVNTKVTASNNTVEVDFAAQNYTNAQEVTELTLPDGTKITFSKGEGSTTPKFYDGTKGIRLYAKNTLTITGTKAIAKVVIQLDTMNANGNEQLYATASGTSLTIVNDWTGTSGGTQFRPQKMTITFAQ